MARTSRKKSSARPAGASKKGAGKNTTARSKVVSRKKTASRKKTTSRKKSASRKKNHAPPRSPALEDVAQKILASRSASSALETRVVELESELSDLRGELERSERRVEAMKQIGRVLGSNLDLDPLLAEIVSRTTDLLEADRSTLFLVDPDGQLWSKVLEGKELREIRLPKGSGIAGWVASHGKPLHIRNAYKDKRFNPEFDRRSGYRTRGMLVWPVRRPQQTEIIGVVQVLNKRSGSFSSTDERLLEAIASEIGVALEVATLYREAVERSEALERARRELLLLFETERAISQSDSLREMLDSILETALATMDAKTGAIHVLDERGLKVEVSAARGTYAASLRKTTLQIGEGVVGNVVKTGEPVCLNDIKGMKRGRIAARSIVAVPIRTRYDGTIGVFELINRKTRRAGFDDDDIKALAVVAAQAGRAIRAERRRKERAQSERLTTIGRMLSGVVHDIRTPMTLISGYTQIMALCEAEEERNKYAHQVNKQIDILSSMTKDLLAFARGERNILIRKVYVNRFMQEMADYLESEFKGSGVTLVTDVKYRGAARFDENKLRRVFHNIARNAREAMPGGGKFSITASKTNGQLVFVFADTGSGVPSELEGKLFEPFSTSGKVGGTGLGLAMVRQIAEEHRGTVDYKSTRRGTKFSFRIPLEA